MATVTKKNAYSQAQHGGVPYGNASKLKFTFETKANGSLKDGNSTAALAIADKVILGKLPAGFEIHDALAIVSDAFTASVTHAIGFEYVDGADDAEVPQDADYLFAALSNAAGRTRASNTAVRPVKLPKDAWLVAVVAGAAHASGGVLDLVIEGELRGAP
ncbi:MAG: hypothetical protein CTY35_05390 [Methylotenera sp.]|nr:MAG: hypothetical protein CTY35_05390 [Methylotenera sp.]